MKPFIFFIALFTAAMASAQDCKGFYYLNNGEIQMTVFDKKGDENGKMTYTITGATKTGNTTTANFASEMFNEKGKSVTKSSGKYKCTDGVLYVDAKVSMPQEQMSAYKDMEVKAEEIYIEYPSTMTAGQSLKDVNFKMEIHNKGSLFATTTFDQTNRKVEGKETITTSAGTWECWKITYEARFKASMAPMNIGVPFNIKGTEWFAPGFGIVKTESFNKNGKLLGSTQITAVKKQ